MIFRGYRQSLGARILLATMLLAGFCSAAEADEPVANKLRLEQGRALATQLGTKEPGIFKTLKQTWFGPMAEALVAS